MNVRYNKEPLTHFDQTANARKNALSTSKLTKLRIKSTAAVYLFYSQVWPFRQIKLRLQVRKSLTSTDIHRWKKTTLESDDRSEK